MKQLMVQSPAKINWTLRVLRCREDGYHDIESLVTAVTLYDDLTFSEEPEPVFKIFCDDVTLPVDERNLIWRAAALLGKESRKSRGMTCQVVKRIPVGGGMGGGSSNAAAALMALNRLWSINWPIAKLMSLAVRLGSDVAFFLWGKTAIISGRGEQIKPVPLNWHGWIVLLMPGISISTAKVYREWRPVHSPVPDITIGAPGGEPCVSAVRWMEQCYNMLEAPAMTVCSELREVVDRSTMLAGRPVRVSGSGSTLYTAFDTESEARFFAEAISMQFGMSTRVVQPVEHAGNLDRVA